MQGKTQRRRCLPPLLRAFAPTRLTEELLAGVYERLLGAGHRSGPAPTESRQPDPPTDCLCEEQTVATGGQS
jgi:hypothetical protein